MVTSIDQDLLDAYSVFVCSVSHTCVNISSYTTVCIFKRLNVFRIIMVLSTNDRFGLISNERRQHTDPNGRHASFV